MPLIEGIRKLRQREHLFCCHACIVVFFALSYLPFHQIAGSAAAAAYDGIMYVDIIVLYRSCRQIECW